MGKNFWFLYIAFFVFIFPLFFSFTGGYTSSPIMATVSLAIGFIGWIIFIVWTYRQTIARPRRMQRNMVLLADYGQLVKGEIVDRLPVKVHKDGSQTIEIVVQFRNFSGAIVNQTFQFIDTKPHEKRYEKGRSVDLRLSKTDQSPGIILAEMQGKFSWGFGLFATSFVIIYMVGTFVGHYIFFSNGMGWRFMSLWHPWVTTPFMGLFLFNISSIFGGLLGTKQIDERLLLYGKKARATVQRADQTGTYINEQPQIKYILEYLDDKGKSHVVTVKKIVLLTDLHLINRDTQDILYLPENPEKIAFMDSHP